MNQEILKFCLKKGILLNKEVGDLLEGLDEESIKKVIDNLHIKEKIITKTNLTKNVEQLKEIMGKDGEKIIEKLYINLGLSIEVSRVTEKVEEERERQKRNIKIISSHLDNVKKLEVGDFVKHFRVRLSEMKRILQERSELENLISINKINGPRESVSIIGLVYNKRITKNKNILLELEDLTGRVAVLINSNKQEVYNKAKEALLDDIVAIKGVGNREIIFANELIYPDSRLPEKTVLDRDEAAVFISDIHCGSRNFLENNFLKFIDWINGEVGDERQRKEALKVKYLFVTGDTIDGVGVYPGQENLLEIKDIYEQYAKLAELLGSIRKDVTIILCAGQHDAVRVAEPQPILDKEYAGPLYELENLIFVSNPAFVEITNENRRGVRILMYHGASFSKFIDEIEDLRLNKGFDNPARVVRHVLKRRHLAPMHSSVTYLPIGEEDTLLIKEVPDIIATADLHKPDADIYNNVLIICSSCWQSTTPFEEKVGNHPDPCKVPVLNLKTRAVKILDFSGEEK